jgi:hypothetical protein
MATSWQKSSSSSQKGAEKTNQNQIRRLNAPICPHRSSGVLRTSRPPAEKLTVSLHEFMAFFPCFCSRLHEFAQATTLCNRPPNSLRVSVSLSLCLSFIKEGGAMGQGEDDFCASMRESREGRMSQYNDTRHLIYSLVRIAQ